MNDDLAIVGYKVVADRAWKPAPLSGAERMRTLAERAIRDRQPLTRSEVVELAGSVLDCLNQHPGSFIVDLH